MEWPSELKPAYKENTIILYPIQSYHLVEKSGNSFFGIAFMCFGLLGTVVVSYEYFFSFMTLLAFFPLFFILVGAGQMQGKDNVIQSIEITENQIKVNCGGNGTYSYVIANIKQFYVRKNGDLNAIVYNNYENHIIFCRKLPKSTALQLAEALETHLNIFDISVSGEVRK